MMSVFEFNDYREYIRSYRKVLPSNGYGFLKQLCMGIGIHTTLMSQILSGKKDFNLEQAQKVCEVMALNSLETDYFLILVQIERAGTSSLKKYFINKKGQLKKESLKVSNRVKAQKSLSETDKSIFYSSWIYSVIHLMCSKESGVTPVEVSARIGRPISQVLDVLKFLLESGLCIQVDQKFKAAVLSTHVEKGSPHLVKHHSNWRIKSIEKSEILTDEELMFTGNISLSKNDFPKVREILVHAIQKIATLVHESKSEEIANLNIDLFKVC